MSIQSEREGLSRKSLLKGCVEILHFPSLKYAGEINGREKLDFCRVRKH